MVEQPFANHYCPHCLWPVDPQSGDHWNGCEYEARLGDWVNPVQPLTELEMLALKLVDCKDELKKTRACERRLKKKIVEIKLKLQQE